ncbi:MAG: sulfite exporter TauE/SafE family protein [Anaerolineaceae bacterium]
MLSLWVAFITGLTTGGLSCMAVQGGLLASSLANQIEKEVGTPGKKSRQKSSPQVALPIVLFLMAKLVAYTLLGALLGALGSVLQMTPTMRAILQFLIAIFMIGNALRMLNVHPIFRYFSFEPPAVITRFIRKKAKNKTSLFTPIFLGALTILIPCGITQSMMAGAIATGKPLLGAALMFAFTLGTSPVFFILSYFATKLGTLLEKQLVRVVAVVLLILGLLSIDTGLNLLGSPYSITKLVQANNQAQTAEILPADVQSASVITLNVVNSGYQPNVLNAPANTELTLNLVTKNTNSCSRAFLIPELNISELLDQTGTKSVQIPAQAVGKKIAFTCSMGMYTGEIVFN